MRQHLRPMGLLAGVPVCLVLVAAPQFSVAEPLGAVRSYSQDVHPHLGSPHGALMATAEKVQEKVRLGSVMRREAQEPKIEDTGPSEDEVVDEIVGGAKDGDADAEKDNKEGEAGTKDASQESETAKAPSGASVGAVGGSGAIKDSSKMTLTGEFQDASASMPMPPGGVMQPQMMRQPMMMQPPMLQPPMMMQPPLMQHWSQPMMQQPMPQVYAQPQMMQPQAVQAPHVAAQAPCSQGAGAVMQPQAVAQVQQVVQQPQYRVVQQPQVQQPQYRPQVYAQPQVVAQTPCSQGAGAVLQPQAVAQVQQVVQPPVQQQVVQQPVVQPPVQQQVVQPPVQQQVVVQQQQVSVSADGTIAESADGTLKVKQMQPGVPVQSAQAAAAPAEQVVVGNIVKQVQKQEKEEEEAALEKEVWHVGTTSAPKEESDFVMVMTFGLIFMIGLAVVGYGMYTSTTNETQRPSGVRGDY